MLEDKRLVRNLRIVAALGVAARQAMGKADDVIRKEVVAIAIESIREELAEEFDVETAVCVVQREVDRILAERSLPAWSPRPQRHRRTGPGPSLPSRLRKQFPSYAPTTDHPN